MTLKERLAQIRSRGLRAAALVLQKRGFTEAPDNERLWRGVFELSGEVSCNAEVYIPPDFPDCLPRIVVSDLPERLPHIERTGQVCLAGTNILLNSEKPGPLTAQALNKAIEIVVDGLAGDTNEELLKEFRAYWKRDDTSFVYSVCKPEGGMREIVVCSGTIGKVRRLVLADTKLIAEQALKRLGSRARIAGFGLYVPLKDSVAPPPFDEFMTWLEADELVRKCMGYDDVLFRSVLQRNKLPGWLLFSSPTPGSDQRVFWSAAIKPQGLAAVMASRGGFRRVNAGKQIKRMEKAALEHVTVRRLDDGYVIARGGAAHDLAELHVMVVGLGAIGGHLSLHLSRLGIGKLTLVDDDVFTEANLCRHVLDATALGRSKVDAVRDAILRVNPVREVQTEPCLLSKLVEEDLIPDDLDLLILATGDHTAELRAAELFLQKLPVLHVWLEPFGIGGHSLLRTSLDERGCLGCTYELHEEHGPLSTIRYLEVDQPVEATVGGCAGTFTPFLGLAADRAALEAAVLVRQAFVGGTPDNALVSWFTPELSLDTNLVLSPRGQQATGGTRSQGPLQASQTCRICRHL